MTELEQRIDVALKSKVIFTVWSDIFLVRDHIECSFLQSSYSTDRVNFTQIPDIIQWFSEVIIPQLDHRFDPLLEQDRHDARIVLGGVVFRASGRNTIEGRIYALRRFPVSPQSLDHIGFAPRLVQALLGKDAPIDGLVLIVGRTGSGKTTAATAFTKEWMTRFGGVSWSVENPIEIDIHGIHGLGRCFQYEVDCDDDFGHAIHDTLRNLPRLIYVGEIRNGINTPYSSGARAALHAATTGHLVVTTMHAGDIKMALASLINMVDSPDAALRISMALRVVLSLELSINAATKKTHLSIDPLFVYADTRGDGSRSLIRDQNLHQLSSTIVQQKKIFES